MNTARHLIIYCHVCFDDSLCSLTLIIYFMYVLQSALQNMHS